MASYYELSCIPELRGVGLFGEADAVGVPVAETPGVQVLGRVSEAQGQMP